jgi:ligand-binding sensor domain-containing protein/two-component sensor histidine kinase
LLVEVSFFLVLLFDKICRSKVPVLTNPLQLHKHAGKTVQSLFIAPSPAYLCRCFTCRVRAIFDLKNQALKVSTFIEKNFTVIRIMKWTCIFLFSFLPSICLTQPAKNIQFNHFSADHGISQPAFTSILQDKKGYMWFGSFTGLIKYDGYAITTFNIDPTSKNSLPDDGVNKLSEDSDGNIWIASVNYPMLTKYNPRTEKFTVYGRDTGKKQSGLPGYVYSLVNDKQGRLWVGTDAGLCFYDAASDKFINLSGIIFPDTLCNQKISSLMVDRNGRLWIGTPNGINIYDPIRKKIELTGLPYKNLIPFQKQVSCMLEDHSGDIWIGLWVTGTGDGEICRYNPATGISKIYRHSVADPHSLNAGPVSSLIEDRFHNIWAGLIEGGISIYQAASDNFESYRADATNRYALGSNKVFSLYEDRSGQVWIGTNGGGLNNCYAANEKFAVYQNYDKEFVSRYPLSLYKDRSERIFMTTFGAGIHEFNPATGTFKQIRFDSPGENLSHFNFCFGITEATDGNLWAVSYGEGLYKLNPKTGEIIIVHTASINDTYKQSNCIVEDLNERLWIGTNTGLKCYNLKTKTYSGFENLYRDTNNLGNDFIASLHSDSKGMLWIAGTEGLVLFNTKSGEVKIFKHDDANPRSISYNHPISFYDAGKGKMWIGTEGGGLNEFDEKTELFSTYTVKDGLPGNTIYGIIDDDRGNLWLSTNKGLCKFTPPSLKNDKAICRNYNLSDGLPANEFYYNTCIKDKDGTLYFGSNAGLVAFKPDELKDNQFIPPVVITGFSIINKSISLNDSTGILKLPADETKEIKLSYRQNVFSFTFAALSYVHPEKNKYAYMLEGFDKDWIYTDATKRVATYTNLDAGNYIFKIKGSNNDGVWNETPVEIKLIITPPWWQTLWFKLLCVFAGGIVVYIIYKSRMQKMRDIRRIRNKIASDLHDDLGATLSSISIMSELVNQQVKDQSPQASSLLEKIGSSSRNMIESVNDMVWAINPQNDSFENVIKRMRTFASEILSAKDIAFHFDFDKNLLQSKLKMEMRRNFYLIFKEAVNNVAKYSQAANAFVMIWNRENNLKMTIRDDGSGFEMNTVKAGNGLINMQQRAEIMKAKFNLESIPGKGTIIELEFKNE